MLVKYCNFPKLKFSVQMLVVSYSENRHWKYIFLSLDSIVLIFTCTISTNKKQVKADVQKGIFIFLRSVSNISIPKRLVRNVSQRKYWSKIELTFSQLCLFDFSFLAFQFSLDTDLYAGRNSVGCLKLNLKRDFSCWDLEMYISRVWKVFKFETSI